MTSPTVIDRNPSPPQEILVNDEDFMPDRIGNTMYSKRWLYKTLMKMLEADSRVPKPSKSPDKALMLKSSEEAVKEKTTEESKIDTNKSVESEQASSEKQSLIELDAKIEEDACTLWDMSANSDVADFLCECNVADSFLTIIEHTKSPRLLEIVVGILGNMAAFNSACEYISNNKILMHSVITLSGCSDSCSLVQLFRLLNCCIANENCQQKWFDIFEENSFFMENLKNILHNNLCSDVLNGLLEFLDRVLNDSPIQCSLWCQDLYATAVIDSGKQLLKCNRDDDLDSFFSVINTLCQDNSGLNIYAKHFEALRPLFHGYFVKVSEDETLPEVSRVAIISSAFAVYGNLLYNESIVPQQVVLEDNVIKATHNLSKDVNNYISRLTKGLDSPNDSNKKCDEVTKTEEQNGGVSSQETIEDELETWTLLVEAIVYACKACISHATEEAQLTALQEILKLNDAVNTNETGT